MRDPGRTLCYGCYRDLSATRYDDVADLWLYECPDCAGVDGPLTIEVPGHRRTDGDIRRGDAVTTDLEIHAGLKQAIGRRPGRWLEFGVVEHLYAVTDPDAYRELVDRHGHVAIAPATNTASWILGRAMWSLQRRHELLVKAMPHGTGRWDYLRPCRAWALPDLTADATVLTWEAFAEQEGFSARSHPAIDWRDTPNAEPHVALAPEA